MLGLSSTQPISYSHRTESEPMFPVEELHDISIDECKVWLQELYAAADRIRDKNTNQYRKIGLLAALLEDMIEAMDGNDIQMLQPESFNERSGVN